MYASRQSFSPLPSVRTRNNLDDAHAPSRCRLSCCRQFIPSCDLRNIFMNVVPPGDVVQLYGQLLPPRGRSYSCDGCSVLSGIQQLPVRRYCVLLPCLRLSKMSAKDGRGVGTRCCVDSQSELDEVSECAIDRSRCFLPLPVHCVFYHVAFSNLCILSPPSRSRGCHTRVIFSGCCATTRHGSSRLPATQCAYTRKSIGARAKKQQKSKQL